MRQETPYYDAVMGKLWLERGGTFVLANIRGGGEFGPAWHEAGLKTYRQRIYDDFYAVAEDLVARKFTSPERLGIEGWIECRSWLMGVEFTQHPKMWKAVVIQVPLLDMLAYEHLSGRRIVGGRIRIGKRAGGAGLSCVYFAVQPANGRCALSRAADLYDDRR